MKIFYIITKSGAGGAQTHIRQLSKHMAQQGYEVAIMSQSGGWFEDASTNNQQPTTGNIKFYPNPHLRNSFNPIYGFRAMKEIRRVVSEFKPDVVSLHSSAAGFWGRLALRNKILGSILGSMLGSISKNQNTEGTIESPIRPSIIFTAHSWGFMPGVPFLRRWVVFFAEKITSRYADKIICVSEFGRQLALKYKIAPEEKLVTVHNGVEIENVERYTAEQRVSAFGKRNAYAGAQRTTQNDTRGAADERRKLVRIIFVGRLGRQKYPELLLEAYQELTTDNLQPTTDNLQPTTDNRQPTTDNRQPTTDNRQQTTDNRQQTTDNRQPRTQLIIVGDGEKRESLARNYTEQGTEQSGIKFLGDLPREEVLEEVAKSDIFVLTSHYEGFPRSILEAMARGLPIIASDVGGIAEALRPLNYSEHKTELRGNENGILLKKNSTEELKRALKVLIEDKSLREKMGQNSRKRAEEEFSLQKMLKETTEVYNILV